METLIFKKSKLIRKYLKFLLGKSIRTKSFSPTKFYLTYPASKYLDFLFKKNIKYEPNTFNNIKKYITPNALIFDVGANLGQYALFFSYLIGPKGKVICYEPDYLNYPYLLLNINQNDIQNAEVYTCALASNIGKATFFIDQETCRTSSMKKEFLSPLVLSERRRDVLTSTLSTEIEKNGVPDFVKIDVEGMEYEVLCGLESTLDTIFLIEVREETKSDIYDYFIKRDYKCLCIDGKEELFIHRVDEIPSIANLLFMPK